MNHYANGYERLRRRLAEAEAERGEADASAKASFDVAAKMQAERDQARGIHKALLEEITSHRDASGSPYRVALYQTLLDSAAALGGPCEQCHQSEDEATCTELAALRTQLAEWIEVGAKQAKALEQQSEQIANAEIQLAETQDKLGASLARENDALTNMERFREAGIADKLRADEAEVKLKMALIAVSEGRQPTGELTGPGGVSEL